MSLPHDCFSNDSSPREFFHQNYMFHYITFVLNITAKYGLKKYLENDLEVYASELANKISEIYNCEIECYDI